MSLAAQAVCLRHGMTDVLSAVSIDIFRGSMTALVGPNGAGKSSLLRMLSGELAAHQGVVLCNEIPLKNFTAKEQAHLRSVMAQSSHIVFDFRVEEVLRMGWVQGDRWGTRAEKAALSSVIAACDIAGLLGRTFNTLSGGEQQRVHFARALLQIWRPATCREPRYLLLDEPTSSLDLAHELTVLGLAREAANQGVGVLVVLHDLNLASRFADKIVLLSKGSIVSVGSPGDVFRAKTLTDVYRTPVFVERHAGLDRLVIFS